MFHLALLSKFQSLPRASWKARIVAALCVVLFGFVIWSTFTDLKPDFATTWIVRGIFIVLGLRSVPRWAMVALTGRMTRRMQFMFDRSSYTKTLSDIHSDVARDRAEERKRTREM